LYAPPPTLSLVVIRSTDIERAARFYSRALGLLLTRESHGGPDHYSSLVDGLTFEIYPLTERALATTSVRLGFAVVGLDGQLQLVVREGGSIIEPPHDSRWGRRAVITDPDGHKIELTEAAA